MTDNAAAGAGGFECVDPRWGERLARLDDPETNPAERQGLEDHLFICDACRLQRAAEAAVIAHLTAASAAGTRPRRLPRRRAFVGVPAWSALALAASLAGVFLWPPASPDTGARRAAPDAGFVRPVEGEVVHSATPVLRWNPVPGATAYEVEISQVEGDYTLKARADAAELRVPAETPLPPGAMLRGVVRPIPTDLAGPVDMSVAFRRAGWTAYALYRLRTAPFVLHLLLAAGLFGLLWEWPRRRRAARQR